VISKDGGGVTPVWIVEGRKWLLPGGGTKATSAARGNAQQKGERVEGAERSTDPFHN